MSDDFENSWAWAAAYETFGDQVFVDEDLAHAFDPNWGKRAIKDPIAKDPAKKETALDRLHALANKKPKFENRRLCDAYEYLHSDGKKDEKCIGRCKFMLSNHSKIVAANYMTWNGDFLFAQAVKDHFDFSKFENAPDFHLREEDEHYKMTFIEVLQEIGKYDQNLAVTVWAWCLEQFLPYIRYASSWTINYMKIVPRNFEATGPALIKYLEEDETFAKNIKKLGGWSNLAYKVKIEGYQKSYWYLADAGYFVGDIVLVPFAGKERKAKIVRVANWRDDIKKPATEKIIKKLEGVEFDDKLVAEDAVEPELDFVASEDKEPENFKDKKVYTYYTLKIPTHKKTYAYLSDLNEEISVGDKVEVPFGRGTRNGRVVKIEHCYVDYAPWPPEDTRRIIRKIPE